MRKPQVLVVDDNPTNRRVAQALLDALGAEAQTVDNGAAALAALNAGAYDLVLMDIHMPETDGIEVAARIRRGGGGDPATPIVALTADARAGERERLTAQGFDDYLAKPVEPAKLASVLKRFTPAN